MRRLYLGRVDERFAPDRDLVAGPWCVIHQGYETAKALLDRYPRPYRDESERDRDRLVLHGATAQLIERFGAALNARHGESLPLEFWRFTLVAPILEITARVLVRARLFQRLIDAHGAEAVTVVVSDRQRAPFDTSAQLIRAMMFDDAHSLTLDSAIIRAIAPAGWSFEASAAGEAGRDTQRADDPPAGLSRKQRLKYGLAIGDLVNLRWTGLAAAAVANLLPKRRAAWTRPAYAQAAPALEPALMALAEEMVHRWLPSVFTTGFPALLAEARRVRFVPGRLRIGAVSRWNDVERCVTALARMAGEKIVQTQHGGGNYGFVRATPLTWEAEYGASDRFLTWGWTEQGDYPARFTALPSPWLSAFHQRHRRTDESIVLVGSPLRFNVSRLDSGQDPLEQFRALDDLMAFVERLPPELRSRFRYRPYRHSASDVDDGALVERRFPETSLLTGNLEAATLGCRVYVANCPNTTLLVAMAANTPTLMYWSQADWPPSDTHRRLLERLRRVGIFHDDPLAAADHLIRVWPDLEGWWRSTEVQEARRDWTDSFASASRWWPVRWLRAMAAWSLEGPSP